MKKRNYWTKEEDIVLKMLYPDKLTIEIASFLEKEVSQVYYRANKLGLKKTLDYMKEHSYWKKGENVGIATQFKKGNVSHNKGVKMTNEQRAKLEPTMFKKGNLPHNTLPIGAIINSNGYLYIKIEEGIRTVALQRHIWTVCYGEIPKGANVQFKDKNPLNCEPENLYLINRKQQMLENSIIRYPAELRKILRLQAKLNKLINTKTEENGTK